MAALKNKKQKPKKGSNLGLFIGLGCGALALVSLLVIGGVVALGFYQGWFKGNASKNNAVAQAGQPNPVDAKSNPVGDGMPNPFADGKPPPFFDKKKKPVGGDNGGKEEKPANGMVAVIPQNFTSTLKGRLEPDPTTLADVEKKLGARGKLIPPDQIDPLVKDIMRTGQVAASAACYQWSSKRGTLFIVFDNNIYTGAAVQRGK